MIVTETRRVWVEPRWSSNVTSYSSVTVCPACRNCTAALGTRKVQVVVPVAPLLAGVVTSATRSPRRAEWVVPTYATSVACVSKWSRSVKAIVPSVTRSVPTRSVSRSSVTPPTRTAAPITTGSLVPSIVMVIDCGVTPPRASLAVRVYVSSRRWWAERKSNASLPESNAQVTVPSTCSSLRPPTNVSISSSASWAGAAVATAASVAPSVKPATPTVEERVTVTTSVRSGSRSVRVRPVICRPAFVSSKVHASVSSPTRCQLGASLPPVMVIVTVTSSNESGSLPVTHVSRSRRVYVRTSDSPAARYSKVSLPGVNVQVKVPVVAVPGISPVTPIIASSSASLGRLGLSPLPLMTSACTLAVTTSVVSRSRASSVPVCGANGASASFSESAAAELVHSGTSFVPVIVTTRCCVALAPWRSVKVRR